MRPAAAAKALHPEASHIPLREFRHHGLLERARTQRPERGNRHQARIELIPALEHFHMRLRVGVAGETRVSRLALLFCEFERLDHAAGPICLLDLFIVLELVDHPKVEVVGLQPPQRLLEHLHRPLAPPARQRVPVRANLRHQENLVPRPLERMPHPLLRAPAVVVPGILEKIHPAFDRPLRDPPGLFNALRRAKRLPADAEHADHFVMPAEFPLRHRPRLRRPRWLDPENRDRCRCACDRLQKTAPGEIHTTP